MASNNIIAFVNKYKGKPLKWNSDEKVFNTKIIGYCLSTDHIIIRFSKKEDIHGWNWIPNVKEDIVVFKRFNFNNYTFWYTTIDQILRSNPELNKV